LKKVFLFALIILITVPNISNAASIKAIKSLVDLPYSNNDQVSDIAISGKNILLQEPLNLLALIGLPDH